MVFGITAELPAARNVCVGPEAPKQRWRRTHEGWLQRAEGAQKNDATASPRKGEGAARGSAPCDGRSAPRAAAAGTPGDTRKAN